jgi:hypothetical protein
MRLNSCDARSRTIPSPGKKNRNTPHCRPVATALVSLVSAACKSLDDVQKTKTFNSGDSPVVTHLTTSPPVRCLNRAERTGSLVFNVLWSNVEGISNRWKYVALRIWITVNSPRNYPGTEVLFPRLKRSRTHQVQKPRSHVLILGPTERSKLLWAHSDDEDVPTVSIVPPLAISNLANPFGNR